MKQYISPTLHRVDLHLEGNILADSDPKKTMIFDHSKEGGEQDTQGLTANPIWD